MKQKHFWMFQVKRAIEVEENNGITAESLQLLKQRLPDLGRIEQVELLMPFGEGYADSRTRFINVKGEYIEVDGFGWGYGGEGADGLAKAFEMLRLPIYIQHIAAWRSEHIRIDVSNPCIYPPCSCPVIEFVKTRRLE